MFYREDIWNEPKKKVAIHYEAYDGSSCKQEKSKY